jgi:hypothetical protein
VRDLAKNDRRLTLYELVQEIGIMYCSYQAILTEGLVCLSQVYSTTVIKNNKRSHLFLASVLLEYAETGKKS